MAANADIYMLTNLHLMGSGGIYFLPDLTRKQFVAFVVVVVAVFAVVAFAANFASKLFLFSSSSLDTQLDDCHVLLPISGLIEPASGLVSSLAAHYDT